MKGTERRSKRGKQEWANLTLQESYDTVVELIKCTVNQYGMFRQTIKTDDKLITKTRMLNEERDTLEQKENKLPKEKLELILLWKKIKLEIRKHLKNYECKVIENILNDSKSTKKINKELFTNKKLISRMYKRDGDSVHGRNEIVEVATNYYRELYRGVGGDKNEDHLEPSKHNNEVPIILYSEVRKALNSLKKEKTVGPDKVDNESLKLFAEELIPTLARLFNKTLVEEEVPIQWNEAEIILVFKKGNKDEIKKL